MGILKDIREFFRGLWVDGVARPLPEQTYLCVQRCIFFGSIGIGTGITIIVLSQKGVIGFGFFPLGYILALLSIFFASITAMMAYLGTGGIRRISTEENVPPHVRHLGVRSRRWFSSLSGSRGTEPRTPPGTESSGNPEDASASSGSTIQVGADIPLRNLQEPGSSRGRPAGEGASSSTEEPASEGASSAKSTKKKTSTSVVNRLVRNLFQKERQQPEPPENN